MNIIITGAGKGIGFELVKLFTNQTQHQVIAISRNISELKKIHQTSGNILPLSIDLEEQNFNSLKLNLNFFNKGKIDILINNAGYLLNKPFVETTNEDINKVFDINFKAPFLLINNLLPDFNENAHIVNIGSMGGFQGSIKFPGLSVYSSAKSALACLTECLAVELKERNIKVNCLCPGAVQTQMLSEAFPGYKAPVDAAEMAVFIADFAINAHRFINGKVIPVSLSSP